MRMLRSVKKEIEKALRTQGSIAGALRYGLIRLSWHIEDLNPKVRAWRAQRDAMDHDFDRKYGVDTSGIVPLSQLDVENCNWIYGARYQPLHAAIDFEDILRGLGLDYEHFTFIDLGSGKGRALLMASMLPFKEIIGVEFCEELSRIAENNLNRFPVEATKCRNFKIVTMDAAEFEFPAAPLVLHLYNPFDPPVLTRVIENIAKTFQKHPRKIIIVLMNPCYSALWVSYGFLQNVLENELYHIYETLPG